MAGEQKSCLEKVVIIGAGLTGCALALALSARGVATTIYESRLESSPEIASGILLTPNGLAILDLLGVLRRIEDRCYIPTHRVYKNAKDETTRKTVVASKETYGYVNHRIWRTLLLNKLKIMLAERGVQICYNSKFNGVVSDNESGVEFRINDKTLHATLLIGSDGIYSTVRNYVTAPEPIVPEYTGLLGLLSHVKRASVAWPSDDYEKNCTIQDKPGAIFFLPEDPEGIDIMVAMQMQYPQQSREDLQRLQADKEQLAALFRRNYDEWGATAKKLIDSVNAEKESIFAWPYLRIPKIDRWYSKTGRVLIIGDAAHAVPPSSGQGANQGFEDIYSLTLLLDSISSKPKEENKNQRSLLDVLAYWQDMRQKRIDAVYMWATQGQNVQRLPEEERKKLIAEGKVNTGAYNDMSWLYKPNLVQEVNSWIESR